MNHRRELGHKKQAGSQSRGKKLGVIQSVMIPREFFLAR